MKLSMISNWADFEEKRLPSFIFNQATFLYPVFDADYELEVMFWIRMNIKNIGASYESE